MADTKDPTQSTLLLGPPVDEKGNHAYFRKDPDGKVSTGILGTQGSLDQSDGFMALEHVDGPMFRITEEIHYSAGRSRPATQQYRDGWSEIFGKKQPVGEA